MATETTRLRCYLLPLRTGKTSHNNTLSEAELLELKFFRVLKTHQLSHVLFRILLSLYQFTLTQDSCVFFANFSRLQTELNRFVFSLFPSVALQNKSDVFYTEEEHFFSPKVFPKVTPKPLQSLGFLKVKVRKLIFILTHFQPF